MHNPGLESSVIFFVTHLTHGIHAHQSTMQRRGRHILQTTKIWINLKKAHPASMSIARHRAEALHRNRRSLQSSSPYSPNRHNSITFPVSKKSLISRRPFWVYMRSAVMHLCGRTRGASIVGKVQNQGLGGCTMWYVRVPASAAPQSTKTSRPAWGHEGGQPDDPANLPSALCPTSTKTARQSNNPADMRVVQTNIWSPSTSTRVQRC